MKISMLSLLALLLASCPFSAAFVLVPRGRASPSKSHLYSSSTSTEVMETLTPELKKMTEAFKNVGDDKLRYKQLLYMANQLEPLANPDQVMVPANKVPGCLSTVHVDGTASYNEERGDYTIDFVGESDGLLTKGLVALLVRGLSGCTAEEIAQVNPEFIKEAKISQSLTPGRNNGFLNMLATMKQKAKDLTEQAKENSNESDSSVENEETVNESSSASSSDGDNTQGPMYNSIMTSLQQLQPVSVKLVDTSYQHAGHAGAKGLDGESHFELEIVADAFEGLSLVKRHQLIYMMLGKEMPQIHALSIKANTPSEVGQ